MPRYEMSEGSSDKFWEIELAGDSFTTRYGRIGTDGQTSTKSFGTPAEAKKAYDKLVAEKLKKGYTLADGGDEDAGDDADAESATEVSNPELEAAILAKPDDVQAYLVYGDWLQSKGNPRGELIALQAALRASPSSKELANAEAKVRAKHESLLLGPLAAYEKSADGEDVPGFTWHLGFLRSAYLAWDHYANEEAEVDLEAAVRLVLSHPSGKFLRELTIGLNRGDPDCEYQPILDAIAETGASSLRELFVGKYEYPDQIEISWTNIGDMNAVWRAVPRLEKLVLQGGSIALGDVVAPHLRHLELRTGGLPAAAVRSVVAATLPQLETLILWTGSDGYGGDSTFADLAPLFERTDLPKLRHLGIMNCGYVDEVCSAIGRSLIVERLETLDLSMGTMSDVGRDALIGAKSALAHLKVLDVSKNCLESSDGLSKLCAEVRVDEQRDDDGEDRYVMVGE